MLTTEHEKLITLEYFVLKQKKALNFKNRILKYQNIQFENIVGTFLHTYKKPFKSYAT